MPASTAAMTTANASVSRTRIGRVLIPAPAPAKPVPPLLVSLRRAYGSCVLPEPVAHAADRLDRLPAERAVDLLAQVADVDVDDVRAAFVRHVPRAFEEL